MRGDAFSPQETDVLRSIVDELLALDDLHGGWESKVDARQTGFSLHVKFDKRVAIQDSIRVATIFEQGPGKLCQIAARVVGQIDAAAAEQAT